MEIAAVLQLSADGTKAIRGTCLKISAEKKVKIGQCAAEHGVLAMIQYYATKLPVPLINMVTTDHCFNLKGRHCFSTSHHLQLVDERAKLVSD